MIEIEIEDDRWTAAVPEAEGLVHRVAEATLATDEATERDVVILLADDETLHDLNRRFRDQDKPTNVLAFPAPEAPDGHLGDIALAYETCAREAGEQGKAVSAHLQHLVAHGVLHLLGYDHMTDAEAESMESLERAILAGLGLPDPYAEVARG